MNVITHLLASWLIADQTQATARDRALVAYAGVAPDLDGIGIVVDFGTRTLGLPETDYYQTWHRALGHGLPAALVFATLAASLARQRLRVAVAVLLVVHLHFLCDIVGSRGTTPEDLWPIVYLAPLASWPELLWTGQWPLVSWQNMLISAGLLGLAIALAVSRGYSIVELFNRRADALVVQALRQRWHQLRGRSVQP